MKDLFPNIDDRHIAILTELYYIRKYGNGYVTSETLMDLFTCTYTTVTSGLVHLNREKLIESKYQGSLDGSINRFWRITSNTYDIIDGAIRNCFPN